jgi:hypothetical protein
MLTRRTTTLLVRLLTDFSSADNSADLRPWEIGGFITAMIFGPGVIQTSKFIKK